MTSVHADQSLGALVRDVPERARVLEGLGIDYCCHGDRTLGEACATAGLDVDELMQRLDAVVPSSPAAAAGPEGPLALIERIVATHHAFLDAELPSLVALASKVRDVHGDRHPELAGVAALVESLADELLPHLRQEEQVVFPAITAVVLGVPGIAGEGLADGIVGLTGDHERAGAMLARLRSLTAGFEAPDDGCASYRNLYERLAALERDVFTHVHLENNVLFPMVRERLP